MHMHAHMQAYTYIYAYIQTYKHVWTYETYTHTRTHTTRGTKHVQSTRQWHTYIHIYNIHTYNIRIYIDACMHTYIQHKCTHEHMHAYVLIYIHAQVQIMFNEADWDGTGRMDYTVFESVMIEVCAYLSI